jgi:hypothetical protein
MTQYYNSGTPCSDLTLKTFSNVLKVRLEVDESVSESITLPQILEHLYRFLWLWFYDPSAIQDSYAESLFRQADAKGWLWNSVQHIWITHHEEIPGLDVRDALESLIGNISVFFYYVSGASGLNLRCVESIEKVMEKAFDTLE